MSHSSFLNILSLRVRFPRLGLHFIYYSRRETSFWGLLRLFIGGFWKTGEASDSRPIRRLSLIPPLFCSFWWRSCSKIAKNQLRLRRWSILFSSVECQWRLVDRLYCVDLVRNVSRFRRRRNLSPFLWRPSSTSRICWQIARRCLHIFTSTYFFFYFFFAGSGGASGKARRLLQWETSHAMNSCHSSLRVHVVVVLVVAQVTRIRLTEIMLTMGLQASRRPKYNAPKATAAPTRETDRCARASLPSRRRRWRRRVRNRRKERPIKLLALSCVSSNLVPIDQSGASSKSYMQFKFPNFHIWFVQRGKVWFSMEYSNSELT